MTEPCNQCPFLVDSGFTHRRLAEHASGEFACHKACDIDGDGTYQARNNKTPHCAGALIFLEKQNAPHQMMRISERLGMYDRTKLNMDANVGSVVGDYRPESTVSSSGSPLTHFHSPKIYPVIHFIDRATAFSEAQKATDAGADGIFLINHHGDDIELLSVACAIQNKHPTLPVGVNFLSLSGLDAVIRARKGGLPMVWGDDVGVDSMGLTDMALNIQAKRASGSPGLNVFASVSFKYRPHEPYPEVAAKNALLAGFIPTTSGSGTGSAPELSKIIAMSKATGGVLAVASGMTPDNVSQYAPYLSHILIATGVALDGHRFHFDKLKLLIANSKVSVRTSAEHCRVCQFEDCEYENSR